MGAKRQRALAKRAARKPARERMKARARREYNTAVRRDRAGLNMLDDCSDLLAPLALARLAPLALASAKGARKP
jgi:hypothetical protein